MNEKGKVIKVEDGIATISLKKNSACKAWMILTARAQQGTQIGDEVFVAVDRKIKSAAIIWLLAVPIAVFVGTALIAQLLLKLSEDFSFLLSVGGLVFAFVIAWLVDKKAGWSKKPVAKIISD